MASDIQQYYAEYYEKMGANAYLGEKVAQSSRMLQIQDWLAKHVKPGGRVLDIGAGDGTYAVQNPQYEWHGLDINISKCQGKKITAVEWDLEQVPYPYPDQHFDAIVTSELLEHLFTPEKVIDQAKRMLKRDGVFIVTTPQHTWIVNVLQGFDNLVYDSDLSWRREHIRTYTYEAHRKLLARSGFGIEEYVGLDAHYCAVVHPMALKVQERLRENGVDVPVERLHQWMGQGLPLYQHTIGLVCKKV